MKRRAILLGLNGALPLVALVAAPAYAQNTPVIPASNGSGMDSHLFRPAMDSKGFFTTDGSEVLGAGNMSFGLVIDYGGTLLRVASAGQQTPALISYAFQGTAQFNYGLWNRVVVGLDVPVSLMSGDQQTGSDNKPVSATAAQWGPDQLNAQTLGPVAAHAKWRITRIDSGIGLALGARIGAPLTNAPRLGAGEPGFYFWPEAIVEKRFGARSQLRLAINAGFRGHPGSGTVISLRNGDYKDGNLVTYGASASYRIWDPVDLVAETYGTYLLSDSPSPVKVSNEAVGGLKVFVERDSYLMFGAGGRYTEGFEAANLRAFIGFIFEPSIGDRDGDGIKDDIDLCPDDPEDKDGFKDEDGCPDPDNDNDGILDINDRCPNVPEDRDGDHDEDGCPEDSDGDRDGDGIVDSKDLCPDEPEDKDGFQDDDGCPDPDNDKDGILDVNDRCPNDPEDKDGFEDEDGCPDPDNDMDGILDVKDKCPNDPENYNGFDDEDGCPDKGSVIIQDNNIIILEKIKFKKASAEILPESNAILDAIATTIVHHPEFLLMEVAGHADERADDNYNLRLTQDRVNSVVKALVTREVDKSRLRSKGYGEYCPEDPGHNEEAWEKNRRVEFKVVKTKDGPTGVELGCENAASHHVVPDPIP